MKNVKQVIKKVVGEERSQKWKAFFSLIKNYNFRNYLKVGRDVLGIEIYELCDKNVFCGYYDLVPERNGKILVHVISKNAQHNEMAKLGYFDVKTKEFCEFAETQAWCWQQGSRLRWANQKNVVFYNAARDGKYVTIKLDIAKRESKSFPLAFYDISKDERYGASLNFDRLQRLRPGYGYSCFDDKTMSDAASDRDGLFIYNFKNNKVKLAVSLKELADKVDVEHRYQHYLNHISFSPNSRKIMFFHLWTEKWGRFNWRNQLCIYDILRDQLLVLESKAVVSHYAWVNDDELIMTGGDLDGEFYRIYDLRTKKYRELKNEHLKRDGHPVVIGKNMFCTDTYPDSNCLQEVFLYDLDKNRYNELIKLYSDPLLWAEKRCDLHPKFCLREHAILVDSTYSDNERKIVRMILGGRH